MPQAGRVSDLSLQDQVVPSPGPGQVRVQVRAVGLNFADVFAAIGLYGATPKGPFVPGLEYSGTVESIGPGVTRVSVGERVYGFKRFGAYATYVVVPQEYVHAMPSGWTMAQGASFVVQGLTAWHGLVELGNTKKGHTVLVHSAAGGVGQLAMELCQKLGAFPIATIGSEAKVRFLLERFKLRREQIIVRAPTGAEFGQQLDEALAACGRAGEGYDVIFDALGGIYFKEGYKRLSRGGRMITYGAATYMSPKDKADWFKIVPNYIRRPMVDPGDLCSENRGVLGFNLIWLTDKVDELNAELEAMLRYDWMAPHVGATFKFEELPDGVRRLQSGQTVGKVVVLVDDGTSVSVQKQDE